MSTHKRRRTPSRRNNVLHTEAEKLWHVLRITRIQTKHMTSYPTLHPSSFKSDGKGKAVQETGRKKQLEKEIWHRFCVAFYTVLRSWEKI